MWLCQGHAVISQWRQSMSSSAHVFSRKLKSRLSLLSYRMLYAVLPALPSLKAPRAEELKMGERRRGVQPFPCSFSHLPWVAGGITTVSGTACLARGFHDVDFERGYSSQPCVFPQHLFSRARNPNALFPFRRNKGLSIDLACYLFALAVAAWKICKKHWVQSWKNRSLWVSVCHSLQGAAASSAYQS